MWYVARSAGLVAWVLLALSVALGVLRASRFTGKRPSAAWLLSIHRYLGGLASIFVAVHVLGIVSDNYVHFGLADVLVPLASSWHPAAVAWGIVAMWLLVAVELTSLARTTLPRSVWRWVHMSSYPLFLLASVHMVSAGTDAFTAPVRALAVGGTLGLTALGVLALLYADRASAPRPAPVPAAAPGPARGYQAQKLYGDWEDQRRVLFGGDFSERL